MGTIKKRRQEEAETEKHPHLEQGRAHVNLKPRSAAQQRGCAPQVHGGNGLRRLGEDLQPMTLLLLFSPMGRADSVDIESCDGKIPYIVSAGLKAPGVQGRAQAAHGLRAHLLCCSRPHIKHAPTQRRQFDHAFLGIPLGLLATLGPVSVKNRSLAHACPGGRQACWARQAWLG